MIVYGRRPVLMDASSLYPFLCVLRADLLSRHPRYRFIVTEHIYDQVRECYPEQTGGLAASLAEKHLEATEVNAADELQTFAQLRDAREFALAECAAIAAAHHRGWPLAIEDPTVATLADVHCPGMRFENATSLMLALIQVGVLQISTADDIKKDWEKRHGFQLPFVSFADGLAQLQRN